VQGVNQVTEKHTSNWIHINWYTRMNTILIDSQVIWRYCLKLRRYTASNEVECLWMWVINIWKKLIAAWGWGNPINVSVGIAGNMTESWNLGYQSKTVLERN
jgi:hypothetical protein